MLKEIKAYYEKHKQFPICMDISIRNGFSFNRKKIFKYFRDYEDLCKQATGLNRVRKNKSVHMHCENCSKPFKRSISAVERYKNSKYFCCRSCGATYNNKHKNYGTRRSKLEVYIESRIKEDFPNIKVICNNKTVINSELDFYFPDLKLAIELNGIFHYEPIYGQDRLTKIQNNDKQKSIECYNKGIEFMTIDSSKFSYFKTESAEKYFQIIKKVINQILVPLEEVESSFPI